MRRRVLYQAHRISAHSTARELPPSKRTVALPARPPPAAGGSASSPTPHRGLRSRPRNFDEAQRVDRAREERAGSHAPQPVRRQRRRSLQAVQLLPGRKRQRKAGAAISPPATTTPVALSEWPASGTAYGAHLHLCSVWFLLWVSAVALVDVRRGGSSSGNRPVRPRTRSAPTEGLLLLCLRR